MCGLTHAGIELIKLNFNSAIKYNPNIFLWSIVLILWVIDRYMYQLPFKIFPTYFIIVSMINIVWYVMLIIYYHL